MHILIVYMFCTNGGVEAAIKNRIQEIDYQEHAVDLLFFQDYGGRGMFEKMGCEVHIESDLNRVKKWLRAQSYDFVISIDTPQILPVLAEIRFAGKIALEVHTTYADSLTYLYDLPVNRLAFIGVPSQYQKSLVERYLPKSLPIEVLPNSIDTGLFRPKDLQLSRHRPIVAWVGRIDVHKNWALYLDIARQAKKLAPGKVKFWLVGGLHSDADEIERFRAKLYANDLYDCFRWIPAVPNDCMPNVYNYVAASGGCYISTSSDESFGMTVIEAMACNCSVVCNNVGALEELVAHQKTGLLTDMKRQSTYEVAKELLSFLEKKEEKDRMIHNARQQIDQDYANAVIARRFLALLKKHQTYSD